MPSSYGQFCPVAMAAEILSKRWTLLVLREMMAGSTRFNELRRGVPRMSPTLLSSRLKELEDAGILCLTRDGAGPGLNEYDLTESGRELKAVVEAMGIWGQRWIGADISLENLDPSLLMWDMRRNLKTSPLPSDRTVINFIYSDLPDSQKHWWLIVESTGEVDLCYVDPGFEVDLFVTSDLRLMTAIWLGLTSVKNAVADDQLHLDGDGAIALRMQEWLGLSPFANETKRVN